MMDIMPSRQKGPSTSPLLAQLPWKRIIIVKPGCEEEVKKAGEAARKLEGPIAGEIKISLNQPLDRTLEHDRSFQRGPEGYD